MDFQATEKFAYPCNGGDKKFVSKFTPRGDVLQGVAVLRLVYVCCTCCILSVMYVYLVSLVLSLLSICMRLKPSA